MVFLYGHLGVIVRISWCSCKDVLGSLGAFVARRACHYTTTLQTQVCSYSVSYEFSKAGYTAPFGRGEKKKRKTPCNERPIRSAARVVNCLQSIITNKLVNMPMKLCLLVVEYEDSGKDYVCDCFLYHSNQVFCCNASAVSLLLYHLSNQ